MHIPKRDEEQELRWYEVRLKATRLLNADREPDNYILDVCGEIICSDETANATNAGTVRAYIIQLGRIINDRASLFEACDAHSQTVHDYSCVLFDFKNGRLKPSIEKQFRVIGARDVLILDRVEILPGHRGQGLGLAAACSFLDTFESGCCLAVAEPFPLQFKEMMPEHAEWCARMGVDAFVRDQQRATEKLRAYWSKLGFRKIHRSNKFALSLAHNRPSIRELLPEL